MSEWYVSLRLMPGILLTLLLGNSLSRSLPLPHPRVYICIAALFFVSLRRALHRTCIAMVVVEPFMAFFTHLVGKAQAAHNRLIIGLQRPL